MKGEKKGIKKELKEVLDLIRQNPNITYNELMTELHITQTPLYRRMKRLKNMGVIKRKGGRSSGKWIILD